MNAYSGTEPYVFLSYAHADQKTVESLIIGLKQKMCRIWYDEGLTPGESWNDELAERIKGAEVFVVALTRNSITSQYVKAEVNYAISKRIRIIPVFLEQLELPAGFELMLSPFQYTSLYDTDDIDQHIRIIASALPPVVFAAKKVPFFENSEYSFFLEKNSMVNGPRSEDKHADSFVITCKRSNQDEKATLFHFNGTKAYDIDFTVTQCKTINDDYFVGSIKGVHIINVLAKCELDYPLYGPDFHLLLVLVLRIPENEPPTVRLIDYQYIHIMNWQVQGTCRIEDSSWGRAIDAECRRKLFAVHED